MKERGYASSPMLFHSDMQQLWTKLQKVGVEMVALGKSLSDKSRTSYQEQFPMVESDSQTKLEQTEACGAYKICPCRCCGETSNGRVCLVYDSCEEMYHVSNASTSAAIEPKECTKHLKAYMNDYGGISRCKFIVQSIFDPAPTQGPTSSKQPLLLAPPTPNKKSKIAKYKPDNSSTTTGNESAPPYTRMDVEDNHLHKKKKD